MTEDLESVVNGDSDDSHPTYPQRFAIYSPRSVSPAPTESRIEAELAEAEQAVFATAQRNAELESSIRAFAENAARLEESVRLAAAIQSQREALIVSEAQAEVTRLSSLLQDASTKVLEARCEADIYAYQAANAGATLRDLRV